MMKKFNKKELEFYLPDSFKGLSKEYLLYCIFNQNIQDNWIPSKGDIIVGCTGNIFIISQTQDLHESLGGTMYFYGGGLCNRNGGNIMDSTFYFTANKSGNYYHPLNGKEPNINHSSIKDFKYVPYPHEL